MDAAGAFQLSVDVRQLAAGIAEEHPPGNQVEPPAQVEEHEDGMTIYPCQTFQPANIQTYNDHRMAMAFSLIGLRYDGVMIENPACVSKTFPNFFEVLDSMQ